MNKWRRGSHPHQQYLQSFKGIILFYTVNLYRNIMFAMPTHLLYFKPYSLTQNLWLQLLQQAWTVSRTQNLRQKANAFQIVEKQCHLHFVMGLPLEIAQTLGAYWYYHSEVKDKYYIIGESKDYMQPAEFVIDCKL